MKYLAGGFITLFLLASGTLAVHAQEEENLSSGGITPASAFFGIERFFENLGTVFTFGKTAKAYRMVALAEERLAETQTLADEGNEHAQRALELYEAQIEEALEQAEQVLDATDVQERVAEATSRHFGVLERVREKVPEEAHGAITQALERSRTGHERALEVLADRDHDRFVDVATRVLAHRAHDARRAAGRGDNDSADKNLDDLEAMLARIEQFRGDNPARAARFAERILDALEEFDDLNAEDQEIAEHIRQRAHIIRGALVDRHVDSLRDISELSPEQAAELFDHAADARLETARRHVEEGRADAVGDEVAEYEKYRRFGEEISDDASGLRTGETTVDDLVERATAHHLEVLRDVQDRVPEKAHPAIERAMQNTEHSREMIRERLERARQQENLPSSPAPVGRDLPVQDVQDDTVRQNNEQEQRTRDRRERQNIFDRIRERIPQETRNIVPVRPASSGDADTRVDHNE